MVTLAAPQIRPLVVGELLTVVYGYGPDRFWQTGQYLGRTTDEH
jgi:hypothetical protein